MTSTNPTNDPESDPNSEIAKKISEELAKVDIHNTAKIKELAQKTMALLTEDFKSRSENPKYTVYVDDNYHYMDEDERYTLGVFDTEEEAVRAAKNVIDKFLPDTCTPGTTAESLYESYVGFGEDPWIPGSTFSAWDYAREKCAQICSGNGDGNKGRLIL